MRDMKKPMDDTDCLYQVSREAQFLPPCCNLQKSRQPTPENESTPNTPR